ncbi:hypothetical protein N752_18685 [Desulforamulus aquiferis]|nr:hypothetical protein [Desulforamulus aquiferis]RYD03775.1 hypothetical protein N752_18685 [Desulforamulus aquiferis]
MYAHQKEVVDHIGGFDLRFGIGNYEDDDYCIRTRLAGYKIVVCSSVFIHHFGSKTFTGAKIDYKELIETNWNKFAEKWNLALDVYPPMSYNLGYYYRGI